MKNILRSALFGFAALVAISNSYATEEKIGVSSDYPSSSPSGIEVVFSADFDGPTRLWISSTDGRNLRKASKTVPISTSISEFEPAWSPNGRQITYVASDGGTSDIWIMEADGTNPRRLTANGAINTQPAWSPDSNRIAFVSDKQGTKDIWLMNADGSTQRLIVALSGEENRPSFSPAGNEIVFAETVDNGSTLMIVNIDGTNLRSLTGGSFQDWDPNWGGNGIVFSSNRDTSSARWKLWVIQPDGTGLRRLGNMNGLSPSWTRDGRVLFTDENAISKAISSVSIFSPANGVKQVVTDIQGYLTPVDIRPGKPKNNVNPYSQGKIEVAILSTRTHDMTKLVDQRTLTFGRHGDERSLDSCKSKGKDLNNDGFLDLRCRFWLGATGLRTGDTSAIVRFVTTNGVPFEGRDTITIARENDPDDFKND